MPSWVGLGQAFATVVEMSLGGKSQTADTRGIKAVLLSKPKASEPASGRAMT